MKARSTKPYETSRNKHRFVLVRVTSWIALNLSQENVPRETGKGVGAAFDVARASCA